MGGISFSRNGQTVHITADDQVLNDKMATNCDSCFEPFPRIEMINIIAKTLIICRGCYLKHHQK